LQPQNEKKPQASTIATDLDSALELLQSNVKGNDESNIVVKELDWELSSQSTTINFGEFTLVLVADCTYNPSSFAALSSTISLALSGSPNSQCILSKKHRHVDEDSLWPSLQRAGLTHELIAGSDARLDDGSLYTYTGWGIYSIRPRVR
jgi:hypothetical protein